MPVWVNKQTYRNRKNCRCFAGKVMLPALVLCLAFQLDALPTELGWRRGEMQGLGGTLTVVVTTEFCGVRVTSVEH